VGIAGHYDDRAAGYWSATVDHTPLSPSADVTGGDFSLATTHNGEYTLVAGDVTGGSVTQENPGSTGCVDQVYSVVLLLNRLRANGTGNGSGEFDGTLIHHRKDSFAAYRGSTNSGRALASWQAPAVSAAPRAAPR
jgi:hypothetical protein